MQKPFVLNYRLNALYKSEQDKYMARKLEKIRASINSSCPESFIFFNSNNFRRPAPKFNMCNSSFFNIKKNS